MTFPQQLAAQYGTPLYVYDLDRVDRAERFGYCVPPPPAALTDPPPCHRPRVGFGVFFRR